MKKLNEIFQRYLYDEFQEQKDRSLDTLMGFSKGQGQFPARTHLEKYYRNVQMMTTMGMLIQKGMKVTHAAWIAYERNLRTNFAPISFRKVRQMYYCRKEQWKKKTESIKKYEETPKDVLEFVPEPIKKKYPHIFNVNI